MALTCTFTACQKDLQQVQETAYEIQDHGTYKLHAFKIGEATTYVKEEDGKYFYSDCERLTQEQFNKLKSLHNNTSTTERATVYKNFAKLWPKGIVYYTLNNIAKQNKKDSILKAMDDMEDKTGVRFIVRTTENDYISFKDANNNSSSLGRSGGAQELNLYNINIAVIQHEIMHALGINHEQCRSDRSNYIIYNTENVSTGYEHNFNINNNFVGLRAFDTESIMLYGSFDFSSNKKAVLTRLDGTTWGNNVYKPNARMSKGDIEGVNFLYQNANMSPILKPNNKVILVSAINNSSAIDLTGNNTTAGNPIVLWELNNKNNQNWKFILADNSEYYIASNLDLNKVIGTIDNTIADGKTIVIKDKDSNNRSQRWKVIYSGDVNSGFIRLSPADNSNLVITINSSTGANYTGIKLKAFDSTLPSTQRFRFLYHQ